MALVNDLADPEVTWHTGESLRLRRAKFNSECLMRNSELDGPC